MQLSDIIPFSYDKNKVACIYLNRFKISLIILYQKINDFFQGYKNIRTSKKGLLVSTKRY